MVPIRSYKRQSGAIIKVEDTLIWRAMVKKACSTFVAFLAEVSRNGIPRPSANSYPMIITPVPEKKGR